MTEKRFTLNKDIEWWFVQDNTIQVNEYGYRDDLTGEDKYRGLRQDLTEQEVVDLLNEQHETIQNLNQQLRIFSDGLKAEIRETKEVFEDYSECVDEKKQLKEENEKLKQLLLQFYTEDEINAELI